MVYFKILGLYKHKCMNRYRIKKKKEKEKEKKPRLRAYKIYFLKNHEKNV